MVLLNTFGVLLVFLILLSPIIAIALEEIYNRKKKNIENNQKDF